VRSADAPPRTVVVVVCGPLRPGMAQRLLDGVGALLQAGGATRLVCELGAAGRPDLALLELLARLQLLARGRGAQLVVSGASAHLAGLAALCGLEVLGQAEASEQRRVQEVVDVRDPSG
jgi:anti-anti-sigma regulatory factor